MNAVEIFLSCLPRPALWRLSRVAACADACDDALLSVVRSRYDLNLAGLLNGAVRSELELMARECEVGDHGTIGELRARLWHWGASLEAPGGHVLGTGVQPVPIVLRGKLVMMRRGNGIAPPTQSFPRGVLVDAAEPMVGDEPETVEQLLDAADNLVGVRLGPSTRDKGAFGVRVAQLLGVAERGCPEPDWRGEVEIKTVPVVRDRSGWWRVKEDPAVSMEHASPLAKLQRVLWIARVADAADSPILSWYYQESDDAVRAAVAAHLHTRPKGPAGATTRGWYLHKRFFADSGFLGSLNG